MTILPSIVDVAQDRKRYLLSRVQRHMEGWQHIWMTSEYDSPCITKGRYIASKEFFEWLSNGGTIEGAAAYLDERDKHWRAEYETASKLEFGAQLERMKATGQDITGFKHAELPGFTMDAKEKAAMRFLTGQYSSSQMGVEHLCRFLKDPYVMGKTSKPPAPPQHAVTEEDDDEDD